MKTCFLAGSLCAFALTTPSMLHADYLLEACVVSTLSVSAASPTQSATMTCPLFDTAIGTLNNWGFQDLPLFSPDTHSLITIQNNTGADLPSAFVFGFEVNANGFFPDGTALGTFGLGIIAGVPAPVLAPGNSSTFVGSNSGLAVFNQISTSSLSSFEGSGNFVVPLSVTSTDITGNNHDPGIVLVNYSATVEVTNAEVIYGYTPNGAANPPQPPASPEPLSAALMLTGLGSLFALHRLRRK